jgi:hypothetical protein
MSSTESLPRGHSIRLLIPSRVQGGIRSAMRLWEFFPCVDWHENLHGTGGPSDMGCPMVCLDALVLR